MSGENFSNNAAEGTNPILEAEADKILADAGYDKNGLNPAEEEAERREWQTMGLEKDVNSAAREIAKKAYDIDDEWQLTGVEKDVRSAAPQIAEKAYDIMTAPTETAATPENEASPTVDNENDIQMGTQKQPTSIGERKPVNDNGEIITDESDESEELDKTGTDD